MFTSGAIFDVATFLDPQAFFSSGGTEIDIWRAANLMLKHSRRAPSGPTTSRPAKITTGRLPGAGSPALSSDSQATHRQDRCTNAAATRLSGFILDNRFYHPSDFGPIHGTTRRGQGDRLNVNRSLSRGSQ